ncbi:MAG: 23S rRNA (adenine(2503)-C(2))-methyltransferase RlmN [Prevotellaceae bacterium]|jgi:23S rRNA (adenine2503-C2)-methyltransferase|nr:23S rRNA (adenine(2503)-C(2))-methyltransferase RlmN [Prevotellaceae bacterium]
METKIPLIGKTLAELEQVAAEVGMPKFAAKQMADWLYKKRVARIADMSNLSVKHREALESCYCIGLSAPTNVQTSKDGTRKYLFEVVGKKQGSIEAVAIPDGERTTLCVSSQAGCKMGCTFCMTARMGFLQSLTSAEIINQIFSVSESAQLSNLVFMGMGEPLDNLDNVLKSLEIITAPWGMAWSPTRVTVSTIGVQPALQRFLSESKCHLAVSLHAPFAGERRELMPMQKAYPIDETIDLIRRYDWTGQRRVSFEYIMFAGVNDTPRHTAALAKMLGDFECRVNLIRFHQIPDSPLRGSSMPVVEKFKEMLLRQGVNTTIRASRGEDILAACGMLSTAKKLAANNS